MRWLFVNVIWAILCSGATLVYLVAKLGTLGFTGSFMCTLGVFTVKYSRFLLVVYFLTDFRASLGYFAFCLINQDVVRL